MAAKHSLQLRMVRGAVALYVAAAIPVLFAALLFYRGETIWQAAFPLLLIHLWVFGRFYVRPAVDRKSQQVETLASWRRHPAGGILLKLGLAMTRLRNRRSPQYAQLLYDLGLLLYEQCRYRRAASTLKQAAGLFSELDDKPNEAVVLMDLGNCEIASGNAGRALLSLQQALRVWEGLSEQQRGGNTWRLLTNLGSAMAEVGDYEAGEAYCVRAYQNRVSQRGELHPETPTCSLNLADIYRRQKRFREAEELGGQALEALERHKDEDLVFAISLSASLHDDQGRCKEAEEMYRQARTLLEQRYGPGHIEVARLLERYGTMLERNGRELEAASLLARAAGIRDTVG